MPKGNGDSGPEKLEEMLAELANGEDLNAPLTADELAQLEDPGADTEFWRTLKERDEIRQSLRRAQKTIDLDKVAFPDLLKDVRLRAGVSVDNAAREARLDSAALLRLESGAASVLDTPVHLVALLMEAFSFTLAVFERSVKRWIAREATKSGMSAPSARSATKRGVDLRMLDDLANVLVDRDSVAATVPSEFLDGVRDTLQRWGRDDLL